MEPKFDLPYSTIEVTGPLQELTAEEQAEVDKEVQDLEDMLDAVGLRLTTPADPPELGFVTRKET